MNVNNLILISIYHLFRYNHEESCQYNKVWIKAINLIKKSLVEVCSARIILRGNYHTFYPSLCGSFKSVSTCFVGNNKGDFAAVYDSCRLCGNPACENCQISLGEMTICCNCLKRMDP